MKQIIEYYKTILFTDTNNGNIRLSDKEIYAKTVDFLNVMDKTYKMFQPIYNTLGGIKWKEKQSRG